MVELDKIEDTLYVPMLGRIYASENFPHILNDKKALELKAQLPKVIKGQDTQTQYTLMAGAIRSVNMDRYIQEFMEKNENGVIVSLGCGLETTYYRNDNGKTMWYEIDLPEVIEYRKEILGETERDVCISADALSEDWIKAIREKHPTEPLMVTASGLMYYLEKDKILNLFKILKNYGKIEFVFDTFNNMGMKRIAKYMKQVGHEDAVMYFNVDNAKDFAKEIGCTLVKEEAYYKYIQKKGLKLITKLTMKIADMLMIVKMEHFKIN